jgi:hypothetical protein
MKVNVADWRIPLRERFGIPDAVTGRGVCIGLLSAFFPSDAVITDGDSGRRVAWAGRDGQPYNPVALTAKHGEMGAHDVPVVAHAAGLNWPGTSGHTGVAPGCDLYLSSRYVRNGRLKYNDDAQEVDAQLDAALAVAAKGGLRVVTIGTRGYQTGPLLPWQWDSHRRKCEQLVHHGVLVVSGAGNMPGSFCPQGLGPSILCVGGIMQSTKTGQPEIFHHPEGRSFEDKRVPDVLAPAEPVLVPRLGPFKDMAIRGVPRGYTLTEGTSWAGPVIAGLAACLLEARPDAAAGQVRWAMGKAAKLVSPRLGRTNVGMPDWPTSLRALDAALPGRQVSCFEVYQRVQEMGWNERLQRMQDRPAEVLLNCLPQPAPPRCRRALEQLFRVVRDPRARAAIVLLCRDEDPAAHPLVETALHSRSPLVMGAALEVLRANGKVDKRMRGRIRELINHADHAVRYEAIRVAQAAPDASYIEPLARGMPLDLDRWQWAAFVARMQCLGKTTGDARWPRSRRRMLPGECVNSPYWMAKRKTCADRWSKLMTRRTD